MTSISEKELALKQLREDCEASLKLYAHVVEPHRVYGQCHDELYDWWQQCEERGILNTLCLMPRDHQKSHCAAVWSCWHIVRDPATTMIYLSATSELASRQLDDIKNILLSDIHMRLWPELINKEEAKREQWNASGFSVDHPKRKEQGVRDPTVSIAGMTTNTTGWHCKILVKDDVVVDTNAYTAEGRRQVAAKCSQLASVLTTGGIEMCVGTRYHSKDHYNDCINMYYEVFDGDEIVDRRKVYAIHERVVEINGTFLWPRAARKSDGAMFGFNQHELALKRAKYTDRRQYRAQYYNDPNDSEGCQISNTMFQYYNRDKLVYSGGTWRISGRKLNIIFACDFSYSTESYSDFTTMMVLGKDCNGDIYVLDLLRFKTDKMKDYFDNARILWDKWKFRKGRAEATAAQAVLVNTLSQMFEEDGINVKLFHFKPNRTLGNKEERMAATLIPLYNDHRVYHYRGGECSTLEEELQSERPPHDDAKDVLAQGCSWTDFKSPARDADEEAEMTSAVSDAPKSRFGGRR